MNTATILYKTNLLCQATHTASGVELTTDAPADNGGNASSFSPTDLVATALATCMLTIMGIAARTHGIHIDGTTAHTTKIMAASPRRIAEIKITFTLPKNQTYTAREKQLIEVAARGCPVSKSLSADLLQTIAFVYA
jgi:uncharacterized OsmC-like protein